MNSSKTIVSVIVPNYNHARFLRARVDSIFNQTFQDFEVILLDDCSSDNSADVLSEYAKCSKVSHFLVNKANSGSPFAQWERGLSLAKGEFIWIAESDDVAEPEFLERMVEVLRSRSNVVLAYCRSEVIDDADVRQGDVPWVASIPGLDITTDYVVRGVDEIRRRLAFSNNIPNTSAVLLRGDTLRRVKLPVDMICCGDWVTWIRVLQQGDIAYNSQTLNLYRTHKGASTRGPQSQTRHIRIVKEFGFATQEACLPLRYQIWGIRRYSVLKSIWCGALRSFPELFENARNLPIVLRILIYFDLAWRSAWQWLKMNRVSRNIRYSFRKLFTQKA
jgi:glycosyltransferase involved in cell wall biosynthesis